MSGVARLGWGGCLLVVAMHPGEDEAPGGRPNHRSSRTFREAGRQFHLHDTDEFARLALSGLDLVPPGIVLVSEWRPDTEEPRPTSAEVGWYGGVGRKQ